MAAALWMPAAARVRQSSCLRSNLTEWQNKVQHLWSLRKQHWVGERRIQSSSMTASCQTSRSPNSWKREYGSPPHFVTPISHRSARQRLGRYGKGIKTPDEATTRHRHEVGIPPLKPLQSQPHCRPKHSKTPFKSSCRPYKTAWKEQTVVVFSGLFTKTQSQLLVDLANRGTQSFLEQLQHCQKVSSTIEPLNLCPRLSGLRCRSSSASSQSARREVLNAIHGYHISADARAQLEKRTDNLANMAKESARSS